MSGKSNILEVFRFLHDAVFPQPGREGVSFALAQRGGINEVLWKGGGERLVSIALEANDPSRVNAEYKYKIELISGAGDYVTTQNESLKLIHSGLENDLVAVKDGFLFLKNLDGKEYGGVGTSGATALQHAYPAWDGYSFYEFVKLWRSYHLVPTSMKESGLTREGQILAEDGHNLSAWLMWIQAHSSEAFGRVSEALQDLFPEITSLRAIPTTEDRVYLAAKEKDLTRETRVFQMSDGFLVLTALLSLIYAPPELAGTLVCIEEPENYLHPRLMETLVALLRQARQELLNSRRTPTQFILTTQSPYLVNQFSLDEVVWIEKKNGETRAFRPTDKEHLRKLVEDKEIGLLGDLMYTDAIGDEK